MWFSVCEKNGGNLASKKLYKKNRDLLVVYYDTVVENGVIVNNSIVYKYQNSTIHAEIPTQEDKEKLVHRVFPRSFINFIVIQGNLATQNYYVTYYNRTKREFPSNYSAHSIPIRRMDLKDFNYIPPARGKARWQSMKPNEKYAGFYDARSCRDVYGLNTELCRNGSYCRTRDPETSESNHVALCTYDIAMNRTVSIRRNTEYEAAYGVTQCNYFVRISNSSDGHSVKMAIFQEGSPTICYSHPVHWSDVYVMRYTNTVEDYGCNYLLKENKKIVVTSTQPPAVVSSATIRTFSTIRSVQRCFIGVLLLLLKSKLYIF